MDFQSQQFGFEVALNEMPPTEINPILGDAIHNLRAALDLCVSAIASARGGNVEKTAFPFAKFGGDKVEKKIVHDVHEAGDEAMQVCRDIKPYPGGNDALWGLHQADIADKHRSLIVTAAMGSFGIRYLPKAPSRPVEFDIDIHYLGLESNFVPAPKGSEFETPAQFGLSIQVVFPIDGPLAGYPVVPTLYALLADVRWIVQQFQLRCP